MLSDEGGVSTGEDHAANHTKATGSRIESPVLKGTSDARMKLQTADVQHLQELDDKIKAKQDLLFDLKRKVEARQQLLTKLREIGEKSKSDSAEFYFQQLNKSNDEIALKDKQIGVHIEKIKDLEKKLAVARGQAAESAKLAIQLRGAEDEIDLIRQEKDGMERETAQIKERSDFELKSLKEEISKQKEQILKLQKEAGDSESRYREIEKTRDQLQAKLEEQAKLKEKASADGKSESVKAE